jgi:hypothetical protein
VTMLTLEGWRKAPGADTAQPLGRMSFQVSGRCHEALEAAGEELQRTGDPEAFIDVSPDELALEMPLECGPLVDCQFRVYLSEDDNRIQFHLVGHSARDNSLVYTNPTLVVLLLS